MKVAVIGDIHACYDELEELIYKLNFPKDIDKIIFVGDLHDKGPKPIETFNYVIPLVDKGLAESILGNHEAKLRKYLNKVYIKQEKSEMKLSNGLFETIKALEKQGRDYIFKILRFLEERPLYINIEDKLLVTHGAWRDHLSNSKTQELCLYGEVRKGDTTDEGYPVRLNNWKHDYEGKLRHIVVGHEIYDTPNLVISKSGTRIWGIDTGAVKGNHLTALVINTENGEENIVQVKSKRQYHEKG